MTLILCVLVAAAVAAAGAAMAASSAVKITGTAEKGKALYDKFCASCHGEKGDGNGPAAPKMDPKPRDFTNKEAMKVMKDEHILKVVRDGKDVLPLFGMRAWKDDLTEEQINDVAAYVKSFAK